MKSCRCVRLRWFWFGWLVAVCWLLYSLVWSSIAGLYRGRFVVGGSGLLHSCRVRIGGYSGSCAHLLAGSLTLLLSQARPSKMPSPVVAQLGSTFQVWSLAIRCRSSMSETSLGRIAIALLSVCLLQSPLRDTNLLVCPACSRRPATAHPSFLGPE